MSIKPPTAMRRYVPGEQKHNSAKIPCLSLTKCLKDLFLLDPFDSKVLRFVKKRAPRLRVFFCAKKLATAWFIQGASPSPCWKRPTPLAIS